MKEAFIDKRTLEVILNDQKAEVESWSGEHLCSRYEESLVDLNSPQAQVVIGVRRSGKSTLCLQTLAHKQMKCDNLLLLTDHEYDNIEKDGQQISIRPVYEWSLDPSLLP